MSIQSSFFTLVLKLIRMKAKCKKLPDEVLAGTFKALRNEPTPAQKKKYNIECDNIDGHKIWRISSKITTSKQHVLYLHGGAYVNGFMSQHWDFICQLVNSTGCTVTAPDYPLAPHHTIDDSVKLINALYSDLIDKYSSNNTTIMGDSAGGGLALTTAQQALTLNLPQPKHIVLISPWLDASLTNPNIVSNDHLDPFLSAEGLTKVGHIYAGQNKITDPLISPIWGSSKGIAPVTLFIGTHDIFLSDCRKFRDTLIKQGNKIDYHEAVRMPHVYVLLGFPEAKKPVKIIEELLIKP